MESKLSWVPAALIALLFGAMIVITFVFTDISPVSKYLIDVVLFLAFSLALGQAVAGVPLGLLINERNLVSLSRFQMALWTVLVLSAYMVVVALQIEGGVPNSLNVGISKELWILLGITTTSLVGSPLLLNNKKSGTPPANDVDRASEMGNEPAYEVLKNSQGTLYANSKPQDAKLTDMFQGDEVGNTNYFDLAKMQMFYFTVIGAICFIYEVATFLGHDLSHYILAKDFSQPVNIPVLPPGYLALMGISNAGYLTGKTVNHTSSG